MHQVRMNSHSIFKLHSQSFTAQFLLGECYLNGNGLAKNEQEAIRLYRAAAFQGYPQAQYELGKCYRDGNGVEKNELIAACLFKTAEDNGYQLAPNELRKLCFYQVIAR
jgi:TPR repeat protein